MERAKRVTLTLITLAVILSAVVLILYNYFYDADKLSIKEREWISENQSTVIDINIPNKLNIFGHNGTGVFFDFIEEVEKEYELTFNKVAIENKKVLNTLGFYIDKNKLTNDLFIYEDYYVVISKTDDVINSYSDLSGTIIGTLKEDLPKITESHSASATYNTYDSSNDLLEALKTDIVKYIIIPKTEYLDIILENNYIIVKHLDEISINYFLRLGDNEVLNSILKKHYNKWIKEEYEDIYYDYKYNLFINKLNLTQVEVDTLTNKNYTFGFTEKAPYKTVSGSNYGGITVKYLEEFTKLTGAEFNLKRYKNSESLVKDFNSKKIDLLFSDTNLKLEHSNIYTNINNKYYVIAPLSKKLSLASLKDLKEEAVVYENSKINLYLKSFPDLKVKQVKTEKKLLKEARKGNIIIIDSYMYDFYINRKIYDYSIRLTDHTNSNLGFRYVNNEDAFYKTFKSYVNTLSEKEMIREGLVSYYNSKNSSNFIMKLIRNILFAISIVSAFLLYRMYTKNKIKLDTRIRKDEKLKFVDLLTSLKNRNYLSEKTEVWNNNAIYPQGVIVIDLNNVKHLNDTFGHTEGDKQIKAAANILIKTQLDNTEIMRTDGNEFMVYLVGYSEKQVLNYIKKIVKEFKKLPYEYGAAVGFSMIVDDLKLIDDAISEATIQMRENKENLGNNYEEEN